jgi:hypothetical protein
MCGVYGFDLTKGKVSEGQRRALTSALISSGDMRGGHAWGWYAPLADRIERGLGREHRGRGP